MYMEKEKKTESKSIRITPKIMKYINSYTGEGFNAKLENMVIFLCENENKLKQEQKRLQKENERLSQQIREQYKALTILEDLNRQIETLQSAIDISVKKFD